MLFPQKHENIQNRKLHLACMYSMRHNNETKVSSWKTVKMLCRYTVNKSLRISMNILIFLILFYRFRQKRRKKVENQDVWCITKNTTYIEHTNRHHKNFMVPSAKHCGTIDGKTKEFQNSFNKQIVMCHKKFIIVFSSEIFFPPTQKKNVFVFVCVYGDFVRRLFQKKNWEWIKTHSMKIYNGKIIFRMNLFSLLYFALSRCTISFFS